MAKPSRISVTSIANLITARNQRYLGTGPGGISPSYPTWSFLSSIGNGANQTFPGAPTGITRVGTNAIGDPRAASKGYTNYVAGTLDNSGVPSGTQIGGNSNTFNLGQVASQWGPVILIVAVVAFGFWFLFRE